MVQVVSVDLTNAESDSAALLKEVERLRSACAEAYQFAGAVGARTRVLDNLERTNRSSFTLIANRAATDTETSRPSGAASSR